MKKTNLLFMFIIFTILSACSSINSENKETIDLEESNIEEPRNLFSIVSITVSDTSDGFINSTDTFSITFQPKINTSPIKIENVKVSLIAENQTYSYLYGDIKNEAEYSISTLNGNIDDGTLDVGDVVSLNMASRSTFTRGDKIIFRISDNSGVIQTIESNIPSLAGRFTHFK